MNLPEILRSINLLLALVVLAWLLLRRVRHPEWYPRGGLRRDIWAMALCWDLALLVGTFEQLVETGTYVRVVVSMAAVLTTISILVRPREDWPKSRDPSSR